MTPGKYVTTNNLETCFSLVGLLLLPLLLLPLLLLLLFFFLSGLLLMLFSLLPRGGVGLLWDETRNQTDRGGRSSLHEQGVRCGQEEAQEEKAFQEAGKRVRVLRGASARDPDADADGEGE